MNGVVRRSLTGARGLEPATSGLTQAGVLPIEHDAPTGFDRPH
jgi:hypothetical protein